LLARDLAQQFEQRPRLGRPRLGVGLQRLKQGRVFLALGPRQPDEPAQPQEAHAEHDQRPGLEALEQAQIRSSRDAAVVFREYLGAADRECFMVGMLDQKNKVIGINTVSMGSLTASVVHPREVMKPAILSNAAALLCCHNHPSGSPQPSREDRALTTRLVDVGKLLGINVLDHIILGDGNETYYSFADEGVL
jgi:DNA repair protein RadC